MRRKRRTPIEPPAAAPKADTPLQRAVRRLLGDPQKQEMVLTKTDPPGQTVKWFYGPNDALEIDFQSGRWHDSERKKGGSILELVMREKQLGQTEAFAWIKEQ